MTNTIKIGDKLHSIETEDTYENDFIVATFNGNVFLLNLSDGRVFGHTYDSIEELNEDVSTWDTITKL